MSLFDYLAKFISSVGFWKDDGTQYEWRRLVNEKNAKYMEHKNLSSIIHETNRVWVKQLDGFRSQLIHNGPELGEITCETQLTSGVAEHSFRFYSPEKAVNKLSIFKDGEKTDLIDGAKGIALQSLVFVAEILKLMREIEYECLHDPQQPDRKRKSNRHSQQKN